MFNFFHNTRTNSTWLGNDERLFTLKLQNVANPLDPHPLWENRYSGNDEITESLSGSKNRRLKDALEAHRCSVIKEDERGWRVITPLIFSDMAVRISEDEWNRDTRLGGKKVEILADNLTRLHNEYFGRDLAGPRPPAYVVMPDPALKNDEVMFQFGLGVFVPQKADQLIGRLELQIKDAPWQPLPQWIFWENSKEILRDTAIYAEQQFLLISPSPESATVRPPLMEDGNPLWFSHGKGCLMFNLSLQRAFGDGEFISDGEFIPQEEDNTTICQFSNLLPSDQDAVEQLLLKIIPPRRDSRNLGTGRGRHTDSGNETRKRHLHPDPRTGGRPLGHGRLCPAPD